MGGAALSAPLSQLGPLGGREARAGPGPAGGGGSRRGPGTGGVRPAGAASFVACRR